MADVIVMLTDDAQQTLHRMHNRVTDIEMEYGEHSDEHLAVLKSFAHALLGVLRLGGTISKDAELSLLGVSWITYGVIFHPKYHDGHEPDRLLGDWSIHS